MEQLKRKAYKKTYLLNKNTSADVAKLLNYVFQHICIYCITTSHFNPNLKKH